MASSVVSGMAFGAAMMAAGFYQPSIVIAQLKFENWHMIQAFLAATATSAVVYNITERLGKAKVQPRGSSPLGLFGTYDGNIIGGAVLGAGMALSGSCPGTLFPQLAAGVHTGFHALDGAILGGIAWTGFLSKFVKKQKEKAGVKPEVSTFNELLGLSKWTTFLAFEAACIAIVAATTIYTPRSPEVKLLGAVGGILIGLTQVVSLATRGSLVGISTCYEELGEVFWWLAGGVDPNAKPRSYNGILFAAGMAAGGWGLLQFDPSFAAQPAFEVSPVLAMVGGALMAVGSRMAGGCTSGHGISGISLFSTSSVVTIASAFAMGAVVAPLAH